MKIKEIEVYQLGEQATGSATWVANSILLKLTTSDGVVGYGEAVPTLGVQPVIQSLREVARVYVDKDPLEVERNRHDWHKHDYCLPVSFESTTAVSAFDKRAGASSENTSRHQEPQVPSHYSLCPRCFDSQLIIH